MKLLESVRKENKMIQLIYFLIFVTVFNIFSIVTLDHQIKLADTVYRLDEHYKTILTRQYTNRYLLVYTEFEIIK